MSAEEKGLEPLIQAEYFARFAKGRHESPTGIMRRSVVDGYNVDEVFTRNSRWEPTLAFVAPQFGHDDGVDFVGVSYEEATRIVDRLRAVIAARATEKARAAASPHRPIRP